MLPESVKASYSEQVEALRKCFKPVDIEELCRIDFHQMIQGSQSVEELGPELQHVTKRAFPALVRKYLDRLLKGCYFLPSIGYTLAEKLGAPKPEESFDELFNQARVGE